ncbi:MULTISPECIES: hypothetical protein [unclassified Serratia (in: enterobacteria)]|uniref:hypothetical protein n=1 Tax=unclassified Serratia (in: enterobacteria) TaxID=2647522 RepID=UPI003FA12CCE
MQPASFVRTAMPAVYCREDAAWIQDQLGQLPHGQRGKIAHAYEEAYRTAFDAEEVSYRQENAGRKAANTRLRLYVERYSRSGQGMTTAPPLVGQNRVAA